MLKVGFRIFGMLKRGWVIKDKQIIQLDLLLALFYINLKYLLNFKRCNLKHLLNELILNQHIFLTRAKLCATEYFKL